MAREFEIIVYGATGFTGRLVAEYLAAHYPDLKWAMAGRSADKLKSVAKEIGATKAAHIVANSDDPQSLADMAARAEAIITTVGPYQLYGDPLVRACVEAGTDYVDLCGEPAWMHDTIRRYDAAAKKSGARIVHSCGFDSVPFDFGVYAAQDKARSEHGGPVQRMKGRVRKMQGTFSGGTAASFMETMKRAQKQPEILVWLKDPFSLTPDFEGPQQPHGMKPVYDEDIGSWSAPFIMASINTKNVHRSNALLGHIYGKDFVYDEMVLTGPGDKGEQAANAVAQSGNSMGKNPPKPGEGPSKDERENGFYEVIFTGDAPDGTRITSVVGGNLDPGYGSTSRMISECALALTRDVDRTATPGGIYTPAAALGRAGIKRMVDNAGLYFRFE
nr:saccharopine dehydrogenase NADP-binding domain-containing protein [Robiginitomaculum antarcticum]